jgi:ubiquinone/menaquinone biosynthesis C-methylase UbiE
MVARARAKARRAGADVTFSTGIAQQLPFPDASFDAVLVALVFHHLPRRDLPHALAEIRRVLTPGGRVLIVDLGGPQPGGRRPHAHARWDVDEVVAPLLAKAGFVERERGRVEFRLRRFERLRYLLAAGPAV